MALFGSIATVRAQLVPSEHFKTAFAYLDECFRQGSDANRRINAIAVGKNERVELADGVFSVEQVYMSKPRSEGFFESHKAYIDIQVLLSGEELLEVTDIAQLRVREDRTPENDVLIYEMTGTASVLRLRGGQAAVFFPVDGHMPSLAIKESMLIRKVVVKVPVS